MKECKGINIAKGSGCGVMTHKRIHGLCAKCYFDWLKNSEAGKEKVLKALQKAKEKGKKYERERNELLKEIERVKENKKLSNLLENTKNDVHKYIRKRDREKPCISCGANWHSDFHAGHFYKAELYSTLRFDFRNIHGQCPQCNLRKDGAHAEYRIGLIKRYGEDYVREIDDLAMKDKQTNHKWDREELNKTRKEAKQKLKELDL